MVSLTPVCPHRPQFPLFPLAHNYLSSAATPNAQPFGRQYTINTIGRQYNLLEIFHFSQVIRCSTGNRNYLSCPTGAVGNEEAWALSPFHQLPFWQNTYFLLTLPVGKKMLKFTKLFLVELLVNIDIVSAFYYDSSKVGSNFMLTKGAWLPTSSILAEVWAQLLRHTKAHSRDNCLISWNFESLRFNLQAHLVCILACFIRLLFLFSSTVI